MSEKKEAKQLSEAEILLLHRKSNPADDLYEGKPVDNESEEPLVVQGSPDAKEDLEELKAKADALEDTKGTTSHSSEAAAKTDEAVDSAKSTETAKTKAKPNASNS